MTRIAVITGSVRPASVGVPVAQWVADKANTVEGVQATVLNLADFNLPMFVEDVAPAMRPATDPAAVRWNEALASYDAYVFVTPEYNFSISGALKNAIDFITPSVLANKAVGLVGYSFGSGYRAVEALRDILVKKGVTGKNYRSYMSVYIKYGYGVKAHTNDYLQSTQKSKF